MNPRPAVEKWNSYSYLEIFLIGIYMKKTSFCERLMAHVREVKRTSILIDASRREVVIANLTFVHDAVIASEQLLIDAAERTNLLPTSPFHRQLAEYYRSHLDEERDHLSWLRDDLKSVGIQP